jgi:hypothetical protein
MIKFLLNFLPIVLLLSCTSKPQNNVDTLDTQIVNVISNDSIVALKGKNVYWSSYYVKSTNDQPEQFQSNVYFSFLDSSITVSMANPISSSSSSVITVFKSKNILVNDGTFAYKIYNNKINGELFLVPKDSLIIIDYGKDSYYFYGVAKI